jgi:hypothetical protein
MFMPRKNWLALLTVVLAACATVPLAPPSDAAYRWTAHRKYDVAFTERLSHEPRAGAEKPTRMTTIAHYTLEVLETDPGGRAHLLLSPVSSEITVTAFGRPPATHPGWLDRDREAFDLSPGAMYLQNVSPGGLRLVVDAEGRWLRDYRGADPPADFFSSRGWRRPPHGVTVYPRPEEPTGWPALFATYVPHTWRTAPQWERPFGFAPQPPMTGMIPFVLRTRVTGRDGPTLILQGDGVPAGKPKVKSVFGLIQFGDITVDMQFKEAVYEARFDLGLGLPASSRLELKWSTQRYATGLGEVISDDSQILDFHVNEQ